MAEADTLSSETELETKDIVSNILDGNAENFLKTVLGVLGIKKDDIKIYEKFFQNVNRFSKADQYKIIENKEINDLLKKLIDIDKEIGKFSATKFQPYKETFGTQWDDMLGNLAELQTLALLEKVADCEDVISGLTGLLSQKISNVNKLLEANLKYSTEKPKQAGGGDAFYKKYLKYKTKYLRLKGKRF